MSCVDGVVRNRRAQVPGTIRVLLRCEVNEEQDLSYEGSIPGDDARAARPSDRRQSATAPATNVSGAASSSGPVFRGVGDVFVKEPIGAVVEVMRRALNEDGKTWRILRPFTPLPQGETKYAFAIMTARPTNTMMRGKLEVPIREPHPAFAAFNTCHPDKAAQLTARIVHWDEEGVWKYHLGAYQHPDGARSSPPDGKWWCRGDAQWAERWDGAAMTRIPCPNRLCEFAQPRYGRNKDQPACRPNLSLIAQFNWRDEKSPLPRIVFEWDSKSWNNCGNCEGMFKLVRETAERLGMGKFPVFGLPFVMSVRETVKARKGRRFPEVCFSVDGDIMEWMGKIHAMLAQGPDMKKQLACNARPLGDDDVELRRASEAALTLDYKPANERE